MIVTVALYRQVKLIILDPSSVDLSILERTNLDHQFPVSRVWIPNGSLLDLVWQPVDLGPRLPYRGVQWVES